jgi:hypothetical protein
MSEETDEYDDWEDEEPAPEDEPEIDYATELKLNRLLRELNESNPKANCKH